MKKLLFAIITFLSIHFVFAAESSNSMRYESAGVLQTKSLKILENSFINYNDTYTSLPVESAPLPRADKVDITNSWLFNITTSKQLMINSIAITMNNSTIKTPVGLVTKNNKAVFQFSGIDNRKIVPSGYKLVAITPTIYANNYKEFNNFLLQKIEVTISWQDSAIYNQTTYSYFMVFAK